MNFKERLKLCVDQQFGGVWIKLSRASGVGPQTLHAIKNGSVPKADTLYLIAKALSVSTDWLLSGEEHRHSSKMPPTQEILQKNKQKQIDRLNYGEKNTATVHRHSSDAQLWRESVAIPQYDISFSAGQGQYPDDYPTALGVRTFELTWLNKKGLKPDNLVLARVHGDSMEPLLKDKDVVMIDRSQNSPQTSMPLAFRLDNELYIKLYQQDGSGNLTMISVNKIYDPIVIDKNNPPDDFEIIGAIVWHGHSWI